MPHQQHPVSVTETVGFTTTKLSITHATNATVQHLHLPPKSRSFFSQIQQPHCSTLYIYQIPHKLLLTHTHTHTHTHFGLHRRYDGSLLVIDESVHACRVQFWSCRSGSSCCMARHPGCSVVVRQTSGLLVYAQELRYACPQT